MKPNLFYLLEEDGRSLAVQNGVVTNFSNPTSLPHSPEGWLKILISFERLMNRFGMQRSFTTPLEFPLEGAFILRDLVYRQNYERKIYFLIQQLTPEVDASFYRLIYRYLYKGELDLSTFDDKESFITCNIMEGGIQKLLKANENTVYEIPFDTDAVNVKMDGILLEGEYNWLIPAYPSLSDGYPSLFQLNNDNPVPGLGLFDIQQVSSGGNPTIDTIEYFGVFIQDIADVHITGTIPGFNSLGSAGPLSVRLIIFNTVTNTVRQTIDLTPTDPYPENYTLDIDQTIDFLEGDRLFLKSASNFTGEGALALSAKSKKATTYTKAYKPYDLFKKLVTLITGATDNTVSTLLQLASESDKLITCGDAIRGLAGAKIKISLAQFYEHVNVLHFAGQGVRDSKIEIETRSYFFDPSDPIDLGDVKYLEVNEAIDMMGNTFKIGWPDPNAEDVNGKNSFNGSHVYSSLITRISKEIQFVSQISADPYEIEMIRINLEGKTTTDDSTDNKVYVIHADLTTPEDVEGVGVVYPLYRRVYDSIEGVPNATVFNVELSPKRLLLKNGPWIRSLLYPFDSQKLTFRSTQRNANLKTVIGSETIQENADQNIFSLGDRLFLPFYAEFGTEIPRDLVSLMEDNPNRCFSFNAYGHTFKGFNVKISIEVNTEQEQKVKLLLVPDTNLLNFIR